MAAQISLSMKQRIYQWSKEMAQRSILLPVRCHGMIHTAHLCGARSPPAQCRSPRESGVTAIASRQIARRSAARPLRFWARAMAGRTFCGRVARRRCGFIPYREVSQHGILFAMRNKTGPERTLLSQLRHGRSSRRRATAVSAHTGNRSSNHTSRRANMRRRTLSARRNLRMPAMYRTTRAWPYLPISAFSY